MQDFGGQLWLLVLIGLLIQWTTLLTLVMLPILVFASARLARSEDRDVRTRFGADWHRYAATTPAFLPRRRRLLSRG